MPETDEGFEQEPAQENENPNIRQLRQKAERADAAEAAEAALRKEVAFLKVGIDTESKIGNLFYKSYEGDLDPEALKAEATELGILKGQEPVKEPESEPSEPTGSTARQELALNAPADQAPDKHPQQAAMEAAENALKSGERWEVGAGEFIAQLAQAAMHGDQRAIVPDRR